MQLEKLEFMFMKHYATKHCSHYENGCERRSEVFVKIQKKKKSGWGV